MSFRNERKETRVGLYTTLIFHLSVLIILLLFSIREVVSPETSFVLDFTKQEQLEAEQKEMEFKEDVSKELEQMLSSSRTNIRNVAVNAGSKLRDDRFKNPGEVYDEARELQRKLDASRREALASQKEEDAVDMSGRTDDEVKPETRTYTGPSVISYDLDGRKALDLKVPAYKGLGAGDVLVGIKVNPKGRVVDAAILSSTSNDQTIQEFAIDAAKRSRFEASTSAPSQQPGTILYRFIAQ